MKYTRITGIIHSATFDGNGHANGYILFFPDKNQTAQVSSRAAAVFMGGRGRDLAQLSEKNTRFVNPETEGKNGAPVIGLVDETGVLHHWTPQSRLDYQEQILAVYDSEGNLFSTGKRGCIKLQLRNQRAVVKGKTMLPPDKIGGWQVLNGSTWEVSKAPFPLSELEGDDTEDENATGLVAVEEAFKGIEVPVSTAA